MVLDAALRDAVLLDPGRGSGCTTALCITIMTKEREGGLQEPPTSNHRPWEL